MMSDERHGKEGETGIGYPMNGGRGRLVSGARNAISARLEVDLAPPGIDLGQFIGVIGAMQGQARTVNEFCAFPSVDAGVHHPARNQEAGQP